MDQVPLVTSPREVGVNANTSSSLPVVRPGTEGLPVVESNSRPSGSTDTESIFSAVVSKPTSLPSKYILKVPAVLLPKDVALKRTTSCGVTAIPLRVMALLKAIKMVLGPSMEKAERFTAPKPTSEPSENRLQFVPSNFKMSSFAEEIPPIIWLPVNERYRGFVERVGIRVAVIVGVAVGEVGVGVKAAMVSAFHKIAPLLFTLRNKPPA